MATKNVGRKKFVKMLDSFSAHGYSRWNVFTDFIEIVAITISNSSDPYYVYTDKKTRDQREERYLQLIGKYKKAMQLLMPQMFAALVEELETYGHGSMTDVLGELFMELNFQDEWKAQFFTPQCVCDLTGQMALDPASVKTAIEDKGFITINEPCCGGGALILGAMNALYKLGYNPNSHALIIANDVDERCVHMCYLQLSLYGIPAIVLQQNTLSLETFGKPWFTPIFVINPKFCKALGNYAVSA